VPGLMELGRLLQVTGRILRDEETDEDLQMIRAPGSSLGGARPKVSMIDQHGQLAIAKFPKEGDDLQHRALGSGGTAIGCKNRNQNAEK
jgi:serine/threonine-protein kinase HipA